MKPKKYSIKIGYQLINESSDDVREVSLKEIRSWLRTKELNAIDITDFSFDKIKNLKHEHNLETICISTGSYGTTGAVFQDEDGNYYVCTKRGSVLSYLI